MVTHDQPADPPVGNEILAESLSYGLKRRLLGKPLVNEQLTEERLTKPLALGVLSCDGISSAAYGTEEILIELLPAFGMAGFALILPMTGVVLLGIVLVVLLYREVVSVYTRAGGSYVVARENFGPRIAQVAAVALLIDYVVTVAVQVAAGSAAIVSAFPQLARIPVIGGQILTVISLAAVLVMCYGNLRGVREAGRTFAVPTYLFSGAVGLMIVIGLFREVTGSLPMAHPAPAGPDGTYAIGHNTSSLITFGAIYILLRAFANGGSSLTGIEAVSNAVSALKQPEGRNARQILVMQGSIVAFLIAGISWLAHATHATPYVQGVPTVLAQEATLVFGHSLIGTIGFYLVQAGTATILFTGGNTSFSGFPFLASFVAEDSFLPRWLTKRGHRLVFSNGIVVLTVVSFVLLLVVGANVNSLVPFYAIGVFTGFTMAGFGMVRYHLRHRPPNWRRHMVISLLGGAYTGLVVLIFAVVKFSEGAWVVLIIFPLMVAALIRLNREYRTEAGVLAHIGKAGEAAPPPPTYARRTVYVFVDDFDLATLAGLRYARSLRPTSLHAVHFIIDSAKAAKLREDWVRANTGIALDLIDCPDRRLARAAAELVQAEAALPGVGVTAVLPRRSYTAIVGRLLHDRTADRIATVVSQIPHAAATIVPFDVRSRIELLASKERAKGTDHAPQQGPPGPGGQAPAPAAGTAPAEVAPGEVAPGAGGEPLDQVPPAIAGGDGTDYLRPKSSSAATPIASLPKRGRAVVEGRIHAVEIRPVERNTVLACEVVDATGSLTALFYGRSHIPGLDPGARVRLFGPVGMKGRNAIMTNPAYELLAPGTGEPPLS